MKVILLILALTLSASAQKPKACTPLQIITLARSAKERVPYLCEGIRRGYWTGLNACLMLDHEVGIGMNKSAVFVSKGLAVKKRRYVSIGGSREVWSYPGLAVMFGSHNTVISFYEY